MSTHVYIKNNDPAPALPVHHNSHHGHYLLSTSTVEAAADICEKWLAVLDEAAYSHFTLNCVDNEGNRVREFRVQVEPHAELAQAMTARGVQCFVQNTGGGNLAVEIPLPCSRYIWLTHEPNFSEEGKDIWLLGVYDSSNDDAFVTFEFNPGLSYPGGETGADHVAAGVGQLLDLLIRPLTDVIQQAADEIREWSTATDYRAEPYLQRAVQRLDATKSYDFKWSIPKTEATS